MLIGDGGRCWCWSVLEKAVVGVLVGDRDRVRVGVSPSMTFYSLSLKYLEELRLVLC